MSVQVNLHFSQSLKCHYIALQRVSQSMQRNGHSYNHKRYDRSKSFHEAIAQHAEGAAAELAVAKYYGQSDYPIEDSDHKLTADLELQNGLDIEVRWTHWATGQLIIYPDDRDSDVAILVTGTAPTYNLIGWIPVIEAKTPEFKHQAQDTWWVAQDRLYHIEDLIRSKHARNVMSDLQG